jgi:hypothetical protein
MAFYDMPEHLEARVHWQRQVEEDDIRLSPFGHPQPGVTVGRLLDDVALIG